MTDFWKNKKVLVTGGAGFIGGAICKKLLEYGAIVTTTYYKKKPQLIPGLKIQKADLTKIDDCLEIFPEKKMVINLAGEDGGSQYKKNHSSEIFAANIKINSNVLKAAKICKAERVFMVSSIDALEYKAESGYVISKIIAERLAKLYFVNYGLKSCVVRLGNIYGPGDFTGLKRGRVIPTFIQRALEKKPLLIASAGKRKFSFLYIDDLIRVIVDVTEKYWQAEPINIVSKNSITIKDLAEKIIQLTKSKSAIKLNSNKVVDRKSRDIPFGVSQTEKKINFSESYTLLEGLKKTINFYL